MDNIKITIEISGNDTDSREQLIAFAKFAKSYQSGRKVETAYEQWKQKQNKP